MDAGHVECAERCLGLAERAAEESRVLTDSLDVLLVRADLHLAVEEDELAWRLLRDRIPSYANRRHFIGEATRHARLDLHYQIASRSRENSLEEARLRDQRLPVHGRVEVACFLAWARERNVGIPSSHAIQHAVAGGFGGVILHLGVVGTLPTFSRSTDPRTSAGRLVESFPTLFPEGLPAALDWSLPAS